VLEWIPDDPAAILPRLAMSDIVKTSILRVERYATSLGILAVAVLAAPDVTAEADIVSASVSQSIDTSADAPGAPPADSDSFLNTLLPPISASRSSTSGDSSATGTQTITNYFGPLSALDTTVSLSLEGTISGSLVGTETEYLSLFNYEFTLTSAHFYTFSFTDDLLTAIRFQNSSNVDMPTGSGILPTGTYELSTISTLSDPGSTSGSFSLNVTAVPEAQTWLSLGVIALGTMIAFFARRKSQNARLVTAGRTLTS
jgi:hypothetical protein